MNKLNEINNILELSSLSKTRVFHESDSEYLLFTFNDPRVEIPLPILNLIADILDVDELLATNGEVDHEVVLKIKVKEEMRKHLLLEQGKIDMKLQREQAEQAAKDREQAEQAAKDHELHKQRQAEARAAKAAGKRNNVGSKAKRAEKKSDFKKRMLEEMKNRKPNTGGFINLPDDKYPWMKTGNNGY